MVDLVRPQFVGSSWNGDDLALAVDAAVEVQQRVGREEKQRPRSPTRSVCPSSGPHRFGNPLGVRLEQHLLAFVADQPPHVPAVADSRAVGGLGDVGGDTHRRAGVLRPE